MAEKPGSHETPIELRQEIAQSRELMVRNMGALRYELNFPLKLRKAFQRNAFVWVGGALAVGLLVALLRARPQKIYVTRADQKVRAPSKSLLAAALLGALKLSLPLVRPMVVSYFTKTAVRKGAQSWRRDRRPRQ